LPLPFYFLVVKKLPEIGSGLGKAIRSFKEGLDTVEDTTGIEGITKKLPGVREVAAVQDKIDKAKDMSKILTK
jgi:sec-independent protein translocase protein TatA